MPVFLNCQLLLKFINMITYHWEQTTTSTYNLWTKKISFIHTITKWMCRTKRMKSWLTIKSPQTPNILKNSRPRKITNINQGIHHQKTQFCHQWPPCSTSKLTTPQKVIRAKIAKKRGRRLKLWDRVPHHSSTQFLCPQAVSHQAIHLLYHLCKVNLVP